MANMTIGPKHPIRALVNDLGDYFASKGSFVETVRNIFDDCDLDIVCHDIDGDEGRGNWAIRPKNAAAVCCEECAARMDRRHFENWLVVTWYKVREGRWEFITYIS